SHARVCRRGTLIVRPSPAALPARALSVPRGTAGLAFMAGRAASLRPPRVGVAEPARGDRAAGDVFAHRTGRERQLGPRNRRAPAAASSLARACRGHRLFLARPLPAAASALAGVARAIDPGVSLQSFRGSDILRAT